MAALEAQWLIENEEAEAEKKTEGSAHEPSLATSVAGKKE
jgi:hypothetical protein